MKPLTPEIEYCRATVKSWERLRLLYNAILLLPGAGLIWRAIHLQDVILRRNNTGDAHFYPLGHPLELIAAAFIFGFIANICYCLGPYLEFVVTGLGFPLTGQRTRYFAFGLGVMLSLAVMGCGWLYVEYFFVSSFIPTPGP